MSTRRKTAYTIGDWVLAKGVLERHKDRHPEGGTVVRWDDSLFDTPREGQVCGGRYVQAGHAQPSSGGYSYDGEYDYDSGCLDVERTHFVYLVREGLTNAPLLVPEHLLTRVTIFDPSKPLPFRKCRQPACPDSVRQILREDARKAPRNFRGRFIKKSDVISFSG